MRFAKSLNNSANDPKVMPKVMKASVVKAGMAA
jgi:hypothetical protein